MEIAGNSVIHVEQHSARPQMSKPLRRLRAVAVADLVHGDARVEQLAQLLVEPAMLDALARGERQFALLTREVVSEARDAHARVIARRECLRACRSSCARSLLCAHALHVGLGGEAVDDAQRAIGPAGEDLVRREHHPAEALASVGAHHDVVADAEVELAGAAVGNGPASMKRTPATGRPASRAVLWFLPDCSCRVVFHGVPRHASTAPAPAGLLSW